MNKKLLLTMFLSMFMISMSFAAILYESNNLSTFTTIDGGWTVNPDYVQWNTGGTDELSLAVDLSLYPEFYVKYEAKTEADSYLKINTFDGAAIGHDARILSNIFEYFDGSWNLILADSHAWINYSYIYNDGTDKFDVSMDGISKVTNGDYRNTITSTDKIYFRSSDTYDGKNMFIKNICVYTNLSDECFFAPTLVITTNLTNGTFFSTNNISIQVNTSESANVTYALNNNNFTSLYNNSLGGILNLFNLSDGAYNITFNATNENGSSQLYQNFNVDLTPPTINNSLPIEINSYLLNISQYVFCGNGDIRVCNITFTPDGNTVPVNQTALYEFTYNSNQSYNIIAEDQAGNIVNESGVILVNPYAYFQFNDSGTLVSNYSFGGILFNGTVANITIYNSILTLGSNTLTFSKLGYVTQDFNVEVLNNSRINTTYNVSQAQINVNIYSRVNGSLLTGVSVFVVIEGLDSGTTTNGTITFKNALFSPGTYSVTSSATGYFTENKDFIYSSQEEVNISLYMLEISNNFSSTLFVSVVDSFTHFLPEATVKLEEFDSSLQNWRDIGQCITNSDGECQFLVEVGSKKYRIYGSKIINGILQDKYSAILGEIFQPEVSNGELVFGNPIIRSISLESTPKLQVPIFSELYIEYPYDENETISFVNDSIYLVDFDVSFQATNNIDYTVCLEFYRIEGSNEKFITKNCTTGSSGTVPLFNYELDRDYTNIIKLTAAQGNNYIIVKEYTYLSNDSLFYILNKDNFVPTTILIAWVLLLTISLYTRQVTVFIVGSFFLSIIELGFFPSFINLAGTVLNIVLGFTLFNIARKKEDNL